MSRFLYCAPLADFLADIEADRLVGSLRARMAEISDQEPSEAERRSWEESLPALADVLRDPEFARGEVFVELYMPLNGRRCDALITGHSASGPSAVVVELKAWSFVQPSHLQDHVFSGARHVVHPSVQVRDYVDTLRHFHSTFVEDVPQIRLHGVVYLHGLVPAKDKAELRTAAHFQGYCHEFPIFFSHESRLFARWLASRLVPGPGKPVADAIRRGRLLPSPKLLDHVVACVKGERDWVLLDEQKTAYFSIRHGVQLARDSGQRRVFIVRGGPGTGKSVLAIQLLADAARQHWRVIHATGSKAFQTVLQAKTLAFSQGMLKSIHNARTKKQLPVADLFATFANVAKVGAEGREPCDLVICDEAHRLWEHRRQKAPNGRVKWLSERSMIDEVIDAALVTAFFLDDNQSVRSGEVGRSKGIIDRCEARGIPYECVDLDAQFRCAGSTSYLRWLDGVLDYRQGLDMEWRDVGGGYSLQVWDDVAQLDKHLRAQRARGLRCRMVAGFCWRWSSPDALGQQPHDLRHVRFGSWSAPWIEKTGKDLPPLQHQYFRWATNEACADQVGSIYSAQGFEFDEVGVIWGEDLVWRQDHWVADTSRNKDSAFLKELRASGEDAAAKLRNVYRVLLSRGMCATHLFIIDDETREHVQRCLAPAAIPLRQVVGLAPVTVAHAESLRSGPLRRAAELPPYAIRPFSPRTVRPDPGQPWASAVPRVDFRVAAGGFGREWRDLLDPGSTEDWITWEGAPAFAPGDFVAQVEGDSMEPMVPRGAWCLFRPAPVEQAVGRTALVRLEGDVEGAASFTLKDIQVEWEPDEVGHMQRSALILSSRNRAYAPARMSATDQHRVSVLAVLLRVLGQG